MNAVACAAGEGLIRLRRDGGFPLRFAGRLIARHDGRAPPATPWHDLALYRSAEAGYAVEIVACTEAGPVRCHAILAETLDAALTLFESHDPVADLCPGVTAADLGFDETGLSSTRLAIQAAVLRCAGLDVERRYRVSVGRFLMALARQPEPI